MSSRTFQELTLPPEPASSSKAAYRIAGNFDGGNFDIFDALQPDCQNLTHQIFKVIQHLVKDSNNPSKYFLPNI